jgi:2-phosphosulfolactate phosphatase
MAIAPIENSELRTSYVAKVNALIDGWFGEGTAAELETYGEVRAALNAVAADLVVVVDVLSFSTSACIAVERGAMVYPVPWRDHRAEEFARRHDAVLAVGRLEAAAAHGRPLPSLSPASLLECEPARRLVLPSPNGSTIAARWAGCDSTVVLGCLRNAAAVAIWLKREMEAGGTVGVIAAGERWRADESLRPALEDHLGAGAIIARLGQSIDGARLSPEARSAADLFEAARDDLVARLHDCAGGRELASKGFAADVDVAAALDVSVTVPSLNGGAFSRAVVA